MESQKLTDYERKRLDNIRRNDEMMAALKLRSKATQLSNSKRRSVVTKSYNTKSPKKVKTETPIVIRRSLRTRGIPPDSKGLDGDTVNSNSITPTKTETEHSNVNLGPLSMSDARESSHSDSAFLELLVGLAQKEAQAQAQTPDLIRGKLFSSKGVGLLNDVGVKKEEVETCLTLESMYLDRGKLRSSKGVRLLNDVGVKKEEVETCLRLESLYLDPENIARVVPGRITSVRFFPSNNVKMVAAGSKLGNIGFWNVGESETHLYHPHRAPISGIVIQPHNYSKIYTSCYDGILRLMDAEKEIFDLVFDSDESIYALSQPANETNCLYLAEGSGGLTIWDNRIGKRSSQWALHERRINTIDFNSENPHIVATGSTDGTACTWDLRYIDGDKLTALRTFTHKKSVQSAYFSPSGCSLATTSLDNTIGIYSGVNLEHAAIINHYNHTGRWLSTFRFDTHNYEVGMLVGATSGGQVYIWTAR